jgi:hypothetical protein
LDKTYVDTWSWANTCLNLTTKANIICFSTGLGDGGYTSYFGFGANGNVVCLVTDFGVFGDEEISEWFI